MTDEPDSLERELAALVPQPLSENCQRRIAARLSQPRQTGIGIISTAIVGAGMVTTACIVFAFYAGLFGRRATGPAAAVPRSRPTLGERRIPGPPAGPAGGVISGPPTVAAYWQALAESTDTFDDLINRQAAREGRPSGSADHLPPLAALTRDWLTDSGTANDR